MLFHLRRSCRLLAHSLHIASPRNISRYGGIAENRLSQTTRQARQAMLGFSWWVYTQWGVRALGRLRPYQMIVAKKAEPAMMSRRTNLSLSRGLPRRSALAGALG